MQSIKTIKLADKTLQQQQQLIPELNSLVRDIERCEKTITDLKDELEAVNAKHKGQSTTQQNIDYLTDLLKCAKKKLIWEKNMASLQKRAPLLLQKLLALMNDPKAPPSEETRGQISVALHAIQTAMDRLQQVKMN